MLMTLPDGYSITQMRAEQPTTSYASFKAEVLSEAGRPFNMPYNIAAAKSAGYNFASAKLDFAVFDKAIGIDQFRVEEICLEPTLEHWFDEARLIPGYIPDLRSLGVDLRQGLPPHEWMCDGQDQLDPRESASKATGISAGIESTRRHPVPPLA